LQRFAELAPKIVEASLDTGAAPDQNVVGAGQAVLVEEFARKRAEAPFHAIADNRISNLFSDGDAEPHGVIAIIARAHQQHETGHGHAPPGIRREEIRAAPYRLDLCLRQAESVLRPRARRAARTLRPPGVAERARKP
jgi:hypothetical protein